MGEIIFLMVLSFCMEIMRYVMGYYILYSKKMRRFWVFGIGATGVVAVGCLGERVLYFKDSLPTILLLFVLLFVKYRLPHEGKKKIKSFVRLRV